MADKKDGVLRKLGRKLMGANGRENLSAAEQKKRKKKIGGALGGNAGGMGGSI